MNTLLLTRSEIEHLVDTPTLDALLRDAFRNYSLERAIPGNRYFSELAAPGAMMILAPGLATGIPAYSVKVHAKYPAELPGIRGALLLNDLQTGALLAVMDSTYLTAVRTGLSAAMATDILARQDASRVAVIGAGTQARFLLRYLHRYRQIKQVCVYDTSIENAESFVTQMRAELGVDIECSVSLPSATRNSDILLLATWSVEPFLTPDLVSSGCHITTLGADQPGEAEVTAELIRDALFVCEQALKELETLGERLKTERVRLGWTQDEMAAHGEVSCPSQKLYEYGKRSPSLHYLYRVSEAGADAVYLLRGEHPTIGQRCSVNLSTDTLRELFLFVASSSCVWRITNYDVNSVI